MLELAICALLVAIGAALMHAVMAPRTLDTQIRRLNLEPGDAVAISAPRRLSPEQAVRMAEQVKECLDIDAVIVLAEGITMDVLAGAGAIGPKGPADA